MAMLFMKNKEGLTMETDLEEGCRVRIKKGQPYEGEEGIYIGYENTPVGLLRRVELDNGRSVLQKSINLLEVERDITP